MNLVDLALPDDSMNAAPAIDGPIGPAAATIALPILPSSRVPEWIASPEPLAYISSFLKLPPRIIADRPCPISWNQVPRIVKG